LTLFVLVVFLQEARRSIFSIMDVITSIRFGEMIFYLAVFILDTGKCYLFIWMNSKCYLTACLLWLNIASKE
jgi:hypothetical protein